MFALLALVFPPHTPRPSRDRRGAVFLQVSSAPRHTETTTGQVIDTGKHAANVHGVNTFDHHADFRLHSPKPPPAAARQRTSDEEHAAKACTLPFRTGRNRPRLAGLGLQQGGCGGLAARSGVLWSAVAGGRAWAHSLWLAA